VFSTSERDDLRDRLIAAARDDERITAAAIVGSGARDAEDAWSDIDLALRLSERLEPHDVAGDWTTKMYECAGAVDHLDVWSGTTLYRVFLLANTLQVDVSFWMSDTFAAVGSSFRLLFGEANDSRPPRASAPGTLVGMGWLYALHARSSIARGRTLQALYMINSLRDQVAALACLRHEPARSRRSRRRRPPGRSATADRRDPRAWTERKRAAPSLRGVCECPTRGGAANRPGSRATASSDACGARALGHVINVTPSPSLSR
jgi:predicted nucleotidyltransferase